MNKWELSELPDLKTGDCLAFEAEGWQKVVSITGAKSFHWGMVGEKLANDIISEGDYSIFDSTDKGITAHLLSEYRDRGMRVYRPRMTEEYQRELAPFIMKRYFYWGDQRYDWIGVLIVAAWVLLRKLGFNIEWWQHDSNKFYCLEFNEIVWRELGFPLVPMTEPPHPANMERSKMLELIWSTYPMSKIYTTKSFFYRRCQNRFYQDLCLIFKGELWHDSPKMITPFQPDSPWYKRFYFKCELLWKLRIRYKSSRYKIHV